MIPCEDCQAPAVVSIEYGRHMPGAEWGRFMCADCASKHYIELNKQRDQKITPTEYMKENNIPAVWVYRQCAIDDSWTTEQVKEWQEAEA